MNKKYVLKKLFKNLFNITIAIDIKAISICSQYKIKKNSGMFAILFRTI